MWSGKPRGTVFEPLFFILFIEDYWEVKFISKKIMLRWPLFIRKIQLFWTTPLRWVMKSLISNNSLKNGKWNKIWKKWTAENRCNNSNFPCFLVGVNITDEKTWSLRTKCFIFFSNFWRMNTRSVDFLTAVPWNIFMQRYWFLTFSFCTYIKKFIRVKTCYIQLSPFILYR